MESMNPKRLKLLRADSHFAYNNAEGSNLHETREIQGLPESKSRLIFSKNSHSLEISKRKYKILLSSKIPNFQNALKYQNTSKMFTLFQIFRILVRRFYVFWSFQAFSTDFSERARKMLKNAAFPVKIGVDTADILAF